MFSNEYKEHKEVLMKKKETAFLTKELKKWEIDQENLPVPKLELLQDKNLAMRYMFTKVLFPDEGKPKPEKSKRLLGVLQFTSSERM